MTTTNYRVGDFLIRIKNAALARRNEVVLQTTKLNFSTAKCLVKEGILQDAKVSDGLLTVKLSYSHKKPVLIDLKLVSKPGLRIYKNVDELKSIKTRSSILILSTPQGILSHKDAIKNNVGGEVLVEVW